MRSFPVIVLASLAVVASCTIGTPPAGSGEGEGSAAEGEGSEGEGGVGGEGEGEGATTCSSTDGLALYDRRIAPLVSGEVPTTCNQCHMEGVDLTVYAQNSACGTMACMINQGVVVLDDPLASPILTFILNSNPATNLITQDVIQQEHDGMLEWIEWSATCNDSVCGPAPADPCGTGATQPPPPEVLSPINGCDTAGLVAMFDQKVFSWRGRCVSCHASYGANTDPNLGPLAPDFFYGTQESPPAVNDAEFSMFSMIGRQLIDLQNPTNSLLLIKPLNQDPTRVHGGGQKFADTNDLSYLDMLSWIQAYDACMQDGAQSPPTPIGATPIIGITSPQNGQTVSAGNVTFRCSVSDAEDGTPANVVWTSNKDGNLGTGCGPFTRSITSPSGFRDITATVTDSDGNVSIDRIAFGIP